MELKDRLPIYQVASLPATVQRESIYPQLGTGLEYRFMGHEIPSSSFAHRPECGGCDDITGYAVSASAVRATMHIDKECSWITQVELDKWVAV